LSITELHHNTQVRKEQAVTIEVQENCYFCKKSLLEDKWVWVCKNCGIAWCNKHKKTEFNWSAWSGLSKENCPNCGNPLQEGSYEVLPKFEDRFERFGIENLDAPEPVEAAVEAQEEVPAVVEEAEPVALAEPETPKKKGIVGAVIMLVIFGALFIFGLVSLFTLLDEGLYWVLLSLGFMSFGGRIAFASIQEIREYYQQKALED
jgi:hypothetical protein